MAHEPTLSDLSTRLSDLSTIDDHVMAMINIISDDWEKILSHLEDAYPNNPDGVRGNAIKRAYQICVDAAIVAKYLESRKKDSWYHGHDQAKEEARSYLPGLRKALGFRYTN